MTISSPVSNIPGAAADSLQAHQALRIAITALINLEDDLLDADYDFKAKHVTKITGAICDQLRQLERVIANL